MAPLEWGLGHATRCIPIIHQLIMAGSEVLVAAEGGTEVLLKKEFPQLNFLPLIGYRVMYSRERRNLGFMLFLQLPKVIITIFREHQWLKKAVRDFNIDAVISDNRFGLFNKKIPSIYITHQLFIKTYGRVTERLAQIMHYAFIRKYAECWVPDLNENGLAGILSHPRLLPPVTKYIGPVSRFSKSDQTEILYDLMVTISGPEPQREIFEKMILMQLKEYNGRVLIVRGVVNEGEVVRYYQNNRQITIVDHLSANEMNTALLQSDLVISRSGYTTIMDLVKLHKKAIFVPTPGQPEQEYLAKYLMEKQMFYSISQELFDLENVLKKAKDFPYNIPSINMEQYKSVINNFVFNLNQ